MKIKSFECPKSINYEKKVIPGTSDAWSMSPLAHRPRDPAYHIEDCQIYSDLDSYLISLVHHIL